MRSLVLVLFVLVVAPSQAEIYKWVDESGNVHFSDSKSETQEEQEIITPKVIPIPDEPDEGELRRLKLIRDAIDAEPEEPVKKKKPVPLALDESKCQVAREQFGILHLEMPLYWAESGELRAAWRDDYYTGERAYIADSERGKLEKRVRSDINTYCKKPGDKAAIEKAYDDWVRSEWCQVRRLDLAHANDPRARASDSVVERLETQIGKHCDE